MTHPTDTAKSDELTQSAPTKPEAIEVERDRDGNVLMCTGCGTVETVASIRRTHPTAFTCCPDRKMVRAIPDLGRWAGVSELVERITAEEGACVTFTGPNPDFNGLPNEVVSVCSSRTDWITEYFRADTLAGCLREALGETGA